MKVTSNLISVHTHARTHMRIHARESVIAVLACGLSTKTV